jgi:hypothetical protein
MQDFVSGPEFAVQKTLFVRYYWALPTKIPVIDNRGKRAWKNLC